MDWRGTDWIIPVYEISMLLLPIYGFVALRRRIKYKVLTKRRAFLHYARLVISPVALYGIFFFTVLGAHEAGIPIPISEGLARSFLPLIGLGLIVWLVSLIFFGLALAFIRNSVSSPDRTSPADVKKRRG